MIMDDKQLDAFFEQARNEEPVAKIEEVKKVFLTGTIAAAGGMLATKGFLKLLTIKKWMMIFSGITVATTIGVSVAVISTNETEKPLANYTPENGMQKALWIANVDEELTNEPEEDTLLVLNEVEEEKVFFEPIPENGNTVLAEEMDKLKLPPEPRLPEQTLDDTLKNDCDLKRYFTYCQTVTPKTTEADFEKMAKAAEKAGISMDYKLKFKEGDLRHIRVKLKAESGNGESEVVSSNLLLSGNYEYLLAWHADENGNVSHLYFGDKRSANKRAHLEERRERLELRAAEMDSACERMMNSFEDCYERTERAWEAEFEENFEAFFEGEAMHEFTENLTAFEDNIEALTEQNLSETLEEVDQLQQEMEVAIKKEIELLKQELERLKRKEQERSGENEENETEKEKPVKK